MQGPHALPTMFRWSQVVPGFSVRPRSSLDPRPHPVEGAYPEVRAVMPTEIAR